MKIEIPLQFFLVCFLILGVSVFLATFYYSNKESFVDAPKPSGDTDLQIQACPSGTNVYTQGGSILCCRGDIVNGTCNGNTVCSTSEEKPDMPSCVTLLRQEFAQKAARFCPPTLPNYFEDLPTKTMGCTDGKRTSDGKAPLDPMQPTCKMYQTYSENKNKLDSCDNIRQRDLMKCPGGTKATLVSFSQNAPALVQCNFKSNTTPQPLTCFGDQSALDYLTVAWPEWRGRLRDDVKPIFCSTAQKYYIERSITDEDLKLLDGPYKEIPVSNECIFDFKMFADNNPSIKKRVGYNEEEITFILSNSGLREGLVYKKGCTFDPLVYAELNPDLKKLYKNNKNALAEHFLRKGIKEKRVFRKL